MQQSNEVEVRNEKENGKEEIVTPHDHDVLCGRGGNINTHPGNEAFRNFVEKRKKVYLTSRFKREKRIITDSIIEDIKRRDPPGRFLSQNPKSKLWFDIGLEKARDKTSQALRENAPKIRKEIERENEELRRKEADRIDYSRRYDPHEHLHEDEQMRDGGRFDVRYGQYASSHGQAYNQNMQHSNHGSYSQGNESGYIDDTHNSHHDEQSHYSTFDKRESKNGYKGMSYLDVQNAVMDTVISHFGCPSYLSQRSNPNQKYYPSEQVRSSGDGFNSEISHYEHSRPPHSVSSTPTPARVPSPSFYPVQQENGKRSVYSYGNDVNPNKSRKYDKEQYPGEPHHNQYNRQYERQYNEQLRRPKTYYPDGREAHNIPNDNRSPVFHRLPSSRYISAHTLFKNNYNHVDRQTFSEKYGEHGYEERESQWEDYDRSNETQKVQKQEKISVWDTFFSCQDERNLKPQPHNCPVKSDSLFSIGWEEEGQEVDLKAYEGSATLDNNMKRNSNEERTPPPKIDNGTNYDWTSGCHVFASMNDLIGSDSRKEPLSSNLARNDSMDLDSLSYTGSLNGKHINNMFDDDRAADGPIPVIGKQKSDGTIMSLGDSLLSINFSNDSMSCLNTVLSI